MTTTATSSARTVARRYVELVNAGDLDGLVSLFRPDATLLHPLGEFVGHDAIQGFYADEILPRGFTLTAVSFIDDGERCAFEVEARAPNEVTNAVDHLTVGADGRVQRIAIYYR